MIVAISRALATRAEEIAHGLSQSLGFPVLDQEALDTVASDLGLQGRLRSASCEAGAQTAGVSMTGFLAGSTALHSDYLVTLTRALEALLPGGKLILMARGAGIILGESNAFRLRVVATERARIDKIIQRVHLTDDEALSRITASDRKEREFVKAAFGKEIDDPLLYDLVINTGSHRIHDAVAIALLAYGNKQRLLRAREQHDPRRHLKPGGAPD